MPEKFIVTEVGIQRHDIVQFLNLCSPDDDDNDAAFKIKSVTLFVMHTHAFAC
jgi:hypothetical protein